MVLLKENFISGQAFNPGVAGDTDTLNGITSEINRQNIEIISGGRLSIATNSLLFLYPESASTTTGTGRITRFVDELRVEVQATTNSEYGYEGTNNISPGTTFIFSGQMADETTASTSEQFGLADDNRINSITEGAWFRHDEGNFNGLSAETERGNTGTSTNITASEPGNLQTFKIERSLVGSSGVNIKFYIENVLETTITTNVPQGLIGVILSSKTGGSSASPAAGISGVNFI